MLFMLRIDVSIPPEMPQADKDALRKRENARAEELIANGTLVRIWRVVGRVANLSLWHTDSLEALHDGQTLRTFNIQQGFAPLKRVDRVLGLHRSQRPLLDL